MYYIIFGLTMNKTVSLDIFSCIDLIYEHMEINYFFAFPDNNFSESRSHQVLSRFSVFSKFISLIFNKNKIITTNPLQEIYFQQIISNANIICQDKIWAYPDKILNNNRSLISIECIDSSLKNYKTSIKLLGEHCLKNNTVSFNFIDLIKSVSCLDYYNYAYPNKSYSEDQAHISFQLLLAITESLSAIINSIKTEDKELTDILSNMNGKLQESKQHIHNAYPKQNFDHSVGHACLGNFIESWSSFKEFSLISLKNYFEKKELIHNYENKINSFSPTNLEIESKKQLTTEEPNIVKKIKSLL